MMLAMHVAVHMANTRMVGSTQWDPKAQDDGHACSCVYGCVSGNILSCVYVQYQDGGTVCSCPYGLYQDDGTVCRCVYGQLAMYVAVHMANTKLLGSIQCDPKAQEDGHACSCLYGCVCVAMYLAMYMSSTRIVAPYSAVLMDCIRMMALCADVPRRKKPPF